MPSSLTITGKVGPGNTVTSLAFTNVIDVDFQLGNPVLSVTYLTANGTAKTQQFDLHATTTVTCSISAGVATFTVSQ